MIKLSDYVIKRLTEHGIKNIFLVTGGGSMHLNDSIGQNPNIKYICYHHEQAAAIAAEGYARVKGEMVAVNVTTGPGGTNAITGLIGQWLDSIPVIYISGQVKFETTIHSCPEIQLRQLGDQEIDIINIVKPVTKYAHMVTDPASIKHHIDKAIFMAMEGRPGPVWLDIPINVQGAMIDETALYEYKADDKINLTDNNLTEILTHVISLLQQSSRPSIVAGHGIRLAGGIAKLYELIDLLHIPVLTTFNGFDLIPDDHPEFFGRIGTVGTRMGNFVLQNSDLLIFIGTRNNIRQISYNWEYFGRSAKKIIIDIDPNELNKKTVRADIAINTDAYNFLNKFSERVKQEQIPDYSEWIKWCNNIKIKYPVYTDNDYKNQFYINPYHFIRSLTNKLGQDDILVAGNGTACVVLFQVGIVKQGQRIFWNSGCASMGYDLPAAIGACFGSGRNKNVICLAGDGSLQMNIQELQTVYHHNLPLKLFVLNNGGYISIRQTQSNFFEGRRVGSDPSSGISFPDIIKIAEAYNIPAIRIDKVDQIAEKVDQVFDTNGPCICEVLLDENYIFTPKLSSKKLENGTIISKPLEDMWPFIDRKEFKENMIIPVIEEE